jgi:hypothetical protein
MCYCILNVVQEFIIFRVWRLPNNSVLVTQSRYIIINHILLTTAIMFPQRTTTKFLVIDKIWILFLRRSSMIITTITTFNIPCASTPLMLNILRAMVPHHTPTRLPYSLPLSTILLLQLHHFHFIHLLFHLISWNERISEFYNFLLVTVNIKVFFVIPQQCIECLTPSSSDELVNVVFLTVIWELGLAELADTHILPWHFFSFNNNLIERDKLTYLLIKDEIKL